MKILLWSMPWHLSLQWSVTANLSECHLCSLSIVLCWEHESSLHRALLATGWSPSRALKHNFDLCAGEHGHPPAQPVHIWNLQYSVISWSRHNMKMEKKSLSESFSNFLLLNSLVFSVIACCQHSQNTLTSSTWLSLLGEWGRGDSRGRVYYLRHMGKVLCPSLWSYFLVRG